ncbi:uncharacterized protein LOC132744466 [Ruditapes philippinarum]|uniref:uncharacterized protein LOC132744466 n=1 Tax=Ruditapes philippinarum TaxID=129788 RepID=UPI00295B237F|nr:uncharacterized protein LOC132744466 [Ruditapes philippinarum]
MCKHIVFGLLFFVLLSLTIDHRPVYAENDAVFQQRNEYHFINSEARHLFSSLRRNKRGFTDIDPSNRATETPSSTTTSTTPPSPPPKATNSPHQTTLAPTTNSPTTISNATSSAIEKLKKLLKEKWWSRFPKFPAKKFKF